MTNNRVVEIPKLVDLCARYVATNIPFERVETYGRTLDNDDLRFDIFTHHHHHEHDDLFDTTTQMYRQQQLPRHPVPEDLQLKIAAESFPSTIDNIRLYSCLLNGNVDEYLRGEQLYQNGCVRRIIQIGFHLSAEIVPLNSASAATAPATQQTSNNTTSARLVLGGASANNSNNYQV